MLAKVGETKYTAGTSVNGGRRECNWLCEAQNSQKYDHFLQKSMGLHMQGHSNIPQILDSEDSREYILGVLV
jgi:hypothetical protein